MTDTLRSPHVPPVLPTSLIQAYYWATSVFVLVDLTLGANLRAAALPQAELRYLYYGLCFGCAVACRRWPQHAPWVGIGESAVNIFLLIFSVMGPIFALPEVLLEGGDAGVLMTPAKLINFLISGGLLWLSFQRSQAAAAGSIGFDANDSLGEKRRRT
jgi:hypothetical protein